MAILHVDSADGDDADSGATWALAKATLVSALTAAGEGDTIYVDDGHSETPASTLTFTGPAGQAKSVLVISVDRAAQTDGTTCTPSAGATRRVSGSSSDISFGGMVTCHGCTFEIGNPGDDVHYSADSVIRLINCTVGPTANNTADAHQIGNQGGDGSSVYFEDCTLRRGHLAGAVGFIHGHNGHTQFRHCTAQDGNAHGFETFSQTEGGNDLVELVGVDLTALQATANLFNVLAQDSDDNGWLIKATNCRMPASWSGAINGDTLLANHVRIIAIGCNDAGDQWDYYEETGGGLVEDNRSIYRDATLDDGTTGWSYELDLTAEATQGFPFEFCLGEIHAASDPTISVEVYEDNATEFTDDQLYLRVEYPDKTNENSLNHYNSNTYNNGGDMTPAENATGWTGTGSPTAPRRYTLTTGAITDGAEGMYRVFIGAHNAGSARTSIFICPAIDVA